MNGPAARTGVAIPDGEDDGFWVPWAFRCVLALPGSALAVGLAALFVAALFDVAWFSAAGVWQGVYIEGVFYWFHPEATANVAYELSFAFSIVALRYLARGADEDLDELLPVLGFAPEDRPAVRREVLGGTAGALQVGVALGLLLALFDLSVFYAFMDFGEFPLLAQGWVAFREIVVDVFFVCVIAWGVGVAHQLSHLASERLRVDLLDLAALRPFTRDGVRLALVWLLLWAIWVPSLLVNPSLGTDAFLAFAVLIGVQLALAGGALAIPTRGPRARLRQAKADALAEVRAAIRRERGAALHPEHAGADAAMRLPGLLAWEARVESIPESLLDADAVRRMGLYLLIPVGSWVAGAVIERWVDLLLD